MIKKTALIIVFICLGYPAMCCKCMMVSLENQAARSTKIFAGKFIGRQGSMYTFLVLKSWKGVEKADTLQLALPQEDNCHRYTPETPGYYMIFADAGGVFNCSSSGFYDDSPVVDKLDELLSAGSWINKNYEEELARIEHDRKYLLQAVDEQINVQDKRIIVIYGKKNVSELVMPFPASRSPLMVFARKADLTAYPSPPDYILYAVYRPEVITSKRRQKIINRTMKKLNQTAL